MKYVMVMIICIALFVVSVFGIMTHNKGYAQTEKSNIIEVIKSKRVAKLRVGDYIGIPGINRVLYYCGMIGNDTFVISNGLKHYTEEGHTFYYPVKSSKITFIGETLYVEEVTPEHIVLMHIK